MILLEAIRLLHEKPTVPAFRVLLCGAGPLAAQANEFIAKNKLEELVSMEGFISEDDKPGYYASADISVFPSTGGESFGIVLLEAMASGKAAVIAANNPGYASVLEPNPDLLFPVNNPQALADKIEAMLIDQSQREQAAEWGATYTRQFDVGVVGKKLLDIYSDALRNIQ
jgi:phosphatidylinositol alpha-mannosyltransferase